MRAAAEGDWAQSSFDLSDRISEYLVEVAEVIEDVESTLSSAIDGKSGLTPETVKTLQKLDFARQAVQDAARLTTFVSCELKVSNDKVRLALHLDRTLEVLEGEAKIGNFSSGDVELF